MRQSLLILLLSSVCVLSGCATSMTAKIDTTPYAGEKSVKLVDNRPKESTVKSKTFETSGAHTYLGDADIQPPTLELIQKWANSRASHIPSNSEITLNEFTVRIIEPDVTVDPRQLEQARQSTPGASPLAAVLAGWFIEGVESIRREKTVTVQISGNVDGKAYEARAHGAFKGQLSTEDISSVIELGLKNAAESISTALSPQKQASQ
jgi:hypothetical protein